ncbi:MAG TPA: DUF3105 domain-containing protein [Egibacteraceae bacterium]|nr:DUF3105 domain-containing protein [Egibacteraceae bacterium]
MAPRTAVVAVGVGALLLAGCGGAPGTAAEVDCGPVEEQPDAGHQHLVGDAEAPVDYATVPPTSGWHFADPDRVRGALGMHEAERPLTETEQASVLAVDAVVVTWRDLTAEQRDALAELATGEYAGRVAVTPYDRLEPGQVVMTAWRTMQVCDGLDLAAVARFVDAHAAAEPDFSMGGADHGDEHGRHEFSGR